MSSECNDELPLPLNLAWRPRAHLDRESIAIYLGVERHAQQRALQVIKRIDNAIDRVRLFPYSGGRLRYDRLNHPDYRTVLADPYIIIYRYDAETLTVYRILHQRQDIDTYAMVDL